MRSHGARVLDREAFERRYEVVRGVEHRRVLRAAVTVRDVRRVVAEDEQCPAGRDRARRAADRPEHRLAGELEIQDGDEVERSALRARRP